METGTPTDSESTAEERYGTIATGDGDLVIYDREQSTAWLQSDHSVVLEA